ncbi:MAG TPA: mechanosensitive ion channel family protein [Candidatus Limnocylindrales bacterium]|nr:mechanosensitive ion channel family protein [Candidatus Limnocylindrales bacterium]
MGDQSVLAEDFIRLGLVAVAVQLGLIVVLAWVALRFIQVTVGIALGRLFDREKDEGTAQDLSAVEVERRRQTLEGLLYRALRLIVLVIAFVMALAVLGLDITPAIAGLGILGLAISLGSQNLVRDYLAGAFVLIENQYARGDVVQIAGITGTVEDVSLRRTSVRDLDGTLHSIPHSLIQVTSNLTRSWSRINVDLPLPYDEDLPAARAAIDAAGREMAADPAWKRYVLKPARVARVERLAEQGLVLKVLGQVAATHRFEATGELRGRILAAFEREGLIVGWRPVPTDRPPRTQQQEEQHA